MEKYYTYEEMMAIVSSVVDATKKQSDVINSVSIASQEQSSIMSNITAQMAIMSNDITELKNGQSLIKGMSNTVQNIQSNVGTLNDRMDQVELREEITTEQKESIRSACRKRINEILGDDPDIYARYYQTFAQSLWKDMRKNCGMGSRLEETHKRDYQRILDGIEAWRPACGIQTLKERKDTNAKARAEAREKGYL